MEEIKTLPNYAVEFIPLERRLNERRADATEMIIPPVDVDRRAVSDRRPLASASAA